MAKETEKEEVHTEKQVEKGKLKKKEELQAYMPAAPFSQRLQKEKIKEQFSRFLDMFKKIEINIPFAEALDQMHNYVKFLKDILSKRRRFVEGVVNLTATCSVVIQRRLPVKMKDFGSFTIPALLGMLNIRRLYVIQGQTST